MLSLFKTFLKTFLYFPVLSFGQDADGGGGAGDEDKDKDKDKDNKPKLISHTQEQLDAMFADRAKQGSRTALEELFKMLGVKDTTELTTLFTEGKKLKDSQLSELDKATKDKTTAEGALDTEKTAHGETVKKYTERLLKAEIMAEAKKAGFRDESLGDVWMLVNAEHRTKITEKDDAFVGVDKVVEEIKKAKPFWLAGDDPKKPKTPGTPRSPKKPGDGTPEPKKGPFKTL